jgi:type II secretory pathway component PulC
MKYRLNKAVNKIIATERGFIRGVFINDRTNRAKYGINQKEI